MIRFTVVWLREALEDLAAIWTSATNRAAVTTAANLVDVHLRVNPLLEGEELSEGLRILELPPIRVIFAVREDDRTVEVYRVLTLDEFSEEI